jgi:flagellar hook assembly protein FlgD
VAATEDYVYVGDYINQRIVRIQKVYELDNIPGLTSHGTTVEKTANWALLTMSSAPNPFTPTSGIRVSMPAAGNLRLCVYDAGGRLVREIARGVAGPGLHAFCWRGDDASGQRAAAGLYVYRLTVGNRVLTARTVMAR